MGRFATDRLSTDLKFRGLVAQVTDPALCRLLDEDRLVAYVGFDPTADSLHVGHLLQVLLLRRLQKAGHRPIALAGGGTGMVGDPGGKTEERPLLEREVVEANLAGIRAQLERLLEFGEGTGALVLDNWAWLGELRLLPFLRDVGKHFTVNQMVAKESVRRRIEDREHGLSYTEFSYMLLQAYDFLHLYDAYGCRLQLGASDQWGNITMGVELVRRLRGGQVFGLTTPLVLRPDGTKFGKTERGAVWLDPKRTSPYEFYQFFVRVEDAEVGRYLRYFTFLSHDEILSLEHETALRPAQRAAQRALARAVTALVHGEGEAQRAERASHALYGGELASLDEATLLEVFAEAPSSEVGRGALDGEGWPLVDALVASGLAGSRGEARRTIVQGGAYVNARREQDPERRLTRADLLHDGYLVLRRGRRDHHLVRVR